MENGVDVHAMIKMRWRDPDLQKSKQDHPSLRHHWNKQPISQTAKTKADNQKQDLRKQSQRRRKIHGRLGAAEVALTWLLRKGEAKAKLCTLPFS